MATVTSTLKMFDGMSGPLKNLTQGMNILVTTMQQMQSATDQNLNVDKMLIAAKGKIASAEAEITRAIQQNTSNQNQFNESVKHGESSADGLWRKIKGFAAAYIGIKAGKDLFTDAYGAVTEQIRAEQRLQSMMVNINGMTQDGIDLVKQRAFELEKTTAIGADTGIFGQAQLAEYVYDPKNIATLTEGMYNLATETYGVNVSQDQIKQTADLMGKAMMGQIDALSRNGFKLTSILDKQQIKMFKYGDETQRTALLMEVLNENQENLAKLMAQTPEGQVKRLKNLWDGVMTTVGSAILPRMQRVIDLITDNMPRIQMVVVGATNAVLVGFDWLMSAAEKTTNWIVENSEFVKMALVAIGIALVILAAQWLIAWIVAAWPIFAVIAAIGGLLWILNKMGVSAEEVVGFITGVFYTWFAWMWNQIAFLYNPFISIAEFLVNVFIDPIYAVKKLFYDMVKDVVGYFGSMISGITKNIDWLINKMNDVTGSNIGTIGTLDNSWVENLKPETDKNVVDFSKYKMEYKDLAGSFDAGYTKGADAFSSASDALSKLSSYDITNKLGKGAWEENPNINQVAEVGKIKDKVDISSEDLKTMRELAEMKNIQNFVTLTPTVSVQTGDINSGQDVDTIVAQITEAMVTHIASSAEGEYE